MTLRYVDCVEKAQRVQVLHIVSGCSNLAQKEYKKSLDKVALRVHWELSKKYDLECG